MDFYFSKASDRFNINSLGEIPIAFLKALEKYNGSENSDNKATFFTELMPSSKSDIAHLKRMERRYSL